MRCYVCKKEIIGKKHTTKDYTGKRRIVCDDCFVYVKLFRAMTPDKGFGGVDKKMFWDEYISRFKTKKMRVGLEKLKDFVIKNHLLGMTGYEYQNSKLYGKYGIYLTLRAWGDFMSALMNTVKKKRKYSYVDFAWSNLIKKAIE
jgi:hypothetical protein